MSEEPIAYRPREFFPIRSLEDDADPGRVLPKNADPDPAPPRMPSVADLRGQTSGEGPGRPLQRATPRIQTAAESVGMLLPGAHPVPSIADLGGDNPIETPLLSKNKVAGKDRWWLHAGTCGQVHDLCRRSPVNRPFYHRPASWAGRLGCAATGFLLEEKGKGKAKERLVATTLHTLACLASPRTKTPNYIVFEFLDLLDNGWIVPVAGVFEISGVYARGLGTRDAADDWALLVVKGTPGQLPAGLPLARGHVVEEEEKLVLVSHSLALPKSWCRGNVIDESKSKFSHSCDTLGGSSGAPLFVRDKKILKVVGLCVRGGHLRSTPSGGTEPIPIGDPTESFFGANLALAVGGPDSRFPGLTAGGEVEDDPWPDEFPVERPLGTRVGAAKFPIKDPNGGPYAPKITVGQATYTLDVKQEDVAELHWGQAVTVNDTSTPPLQFTVRPW